MNHYEVLGLKKNATQNEIREAYKKLIKKYHPDIYQGDKTFAEKKSQSINAAYDVLSNPESRKKYDDEITPTTNNYSTYKYSTNTSKYSYEYYKRNNYSEYSSYNDFNQRRYSNYHRSKVPNSNYTNYSNRKSFFESIFKTSKQQIIAIIVIFLIYLCTLFSNISKYTLDFKNSKEYNSNSSNSFSDSFYSNYKYFDINEYYSDDELHEIFDTRYSERFDSFEEFKEAFSQYVYVYLYSN